MLNAPNNKNIKDMLVKKLFSFFELYLKLYHWHEPTTDKKIESVLGFTMILHNIPFKSIRTKAKNNAFSLPRDKGEILQHIEMPSQYTCNY